MCGVPPPTLLWAGGLSFNRSDSEKDGQKKETPSKIGTTRTPHESTGQLIQIISNAHIYQPIKRVFDYVSTPENDFQWQYGTLASTPTPGSSAGMGACFQSTGHFMGHRIQSTFEVTEYEPNIKYGFKSLSGPLQSYTSYVFDIAKGFTEIKLSMQANVINALDFNENVLEKKMKKQLKENLAMLKDILEAG